MADDGGGRKGGVKKEKKVQVPVRRWGKEDLTTRTRQAAEKATGNLVLVAETPGLAARKFTGSGGSEKGSPLGRSLDPGTMPAPANHPQPKLCHPSSDSLCSPVVHCGSIQRLRGCSGAERSQEVRPANTVGTAPAATVRAGIFSVRRGWGVAVTVFRQLGLNPSPAPRPAPLEFSALGQSGAPSKPAAPFRTR